MKYVDRLPYLQWKNIKRLTVLMVCIGLFPSLVVAASPQYEDDPGQNLYAKGLKDIKAGNWQKAITIWTTYLGNLDTHHKSDPRTAIKYIETVTKNRDFENYENASTFYIDNMEYASWNESPKILTREVERLLPIVPDKIKKQWKHQLKKKNPDLFREIAFYWKQVDPILSTKVNERLIEHWQRIAYARKYFTRNHTSVYGTDDRGVIYIKFGKPYERLKEAIPFHGVSNPLTGLPVAINGREFHPHLPLIVNFELWSYNFSNRKVPSYYLFGQKNNAGRFSLQPGILSVIPSYGYSFRAAGIDSRGGKLMIKYGILDEIKGLNNYFGNLYSDMTRDMIINSSEGDRGAAVFQEPSVLFKFENKEALQSNRRDQLSPPNTTSIITKEKFMPVDYAVYRFLNKDRQTVYYIAAYPEIYVFRKRIRKMQKRYDRLPDMKLYSTFFSYNTYGDRQNIERKKTSVLSGRINHPVLFNINSDSVGETILMGMDLADEGNPRHILIDDQKKSPLIGSTGPVKIQLPPTLPATTGQMTVSDPVIGQMQKTDENKRIPFYPAVNKNFKMNSHMLVYFETYHIKSPNYTVEYRFDRFRGDSPKGKVRPYKDKAAATVEYNTEYQKDGHWFSINLSDLRPGWYDFVMTVRVPGNKLIIERRVPFQIVE